MPKLFNNFCPPKIQYIIGTQMTFVFLEAFLIALAISIDTLVAAFGYGISKIKIPFRSALFITFINTLVLALSILVGFLLKGAVSLTFAKWFSFALLILVGLFKLFSELLKLWLSKKVDKPIQVKVFNFQLMLNVLTDSTKADVNKDKVLSILEAISISLVLALDEIGVGISTGVSNSYPYIVLIFNFFTCLAAVYVGLFIGKKISNHSKINLSWLSGLILIILAVVRLFL